MKLLSSISKLLLTLPLIVLSGCKLPFLEDIENKRRAEAFVFYKQGEALNESGDKEGAIASYTKAIETDPTYADSYKDRGMVYQSLKKYRAAIADYTQFIKYVRKTSLQKDYMYFERAQLYHQLGNYTAAKSDYQEAISRNANKYLSAFRIALIEYEIGSSIDEIIEKIQQTYSLYVEHQKTEEAAKTQMLLAVAYYRKQEPNKAVKIAKKSLQENLYFYPKALINLNTKELKKKFWGELLLEDIKDFYSTPEMQKLLPRKNFY